MNMHRQMMNLKCDVDANLPVGCGEAMAYKHGHKDALHAAAELALKADALAEALRDMLMHIGKGREDGAEWVCEPIHCDEIKAARSALAAFGDA